MGLVIVVFGMVGVALAAGWVAQLLVGRHGRTDWTEVGWVGLLGVVIAGGIAWLIDGEFGSVFSVSGMLLAIGVSFLIMSFVTTRQAAARRAERHRQRALTPEGLPGHHQPQQHHHPNKKKRKKRR
jgi:hypothetical protein